MKVYHVGSGKKERLCSACGEAIAVGDPYKWIKLNRTFPRRDYHQHCSIPASHTTTNYDEIEAIGAVEEAQAALFEYAQQAGADVETLEQIVTNLDNRLDELEQAIQEKIDSQYENFPSGNPVIEALEEKLEAIQDWRIQLDDINIDDDELVLSDKLTEVEEVISGFSL